MAGVLITSKTEAKKLYEKFQNSDGTLAIDLETSSLDPRNGEVVGVVLATQEETYYLPVLVGQRPVPEAQISLAPPDDERYLNWGRGKKKGSIGIGHVHLRDGNVITQSQEGGYPLVRGPCYGWWKDLMMGLYKYVSWLVFQNAKYDLGWLYHEGVHPVEHSRVPEGRILDTMGLGHMYEEGMSLGLKEMSYIILDRQQTEFDPWVVYHWNPRVAAYYAWQDGRNTFDLGRWFSEALIGDGLWDTYLKLYQPMMYVAELMERHGMKLDVEAVREDQKWLKKKRAELGLVLEGLSPGMENPRSWQQRSRALAGYWYYPGLDEARELEDEDEAAEAAATALRRKPKQGFKGLGLKPNEDWLNGSELVEYPTGSNRWIRRLSTSKKVLPDMEQEAREAQGRGEQGAEALLKWLETYKAWKKADKYLSFIENNNDGGLLQIRDEEDFVYPSWWPFGTVTGRWSSSGPNLQQQPRPYDFGDRVINPRRWFVAPEGYMLLVADYSQAELFVIAALSGDQKRIEACRSGDVHTATARLIAQVQEKDWDELDEKEQKKRRQRAKTANYGKAYGATPYTMAQNTGMLVEEAEAFYKTLADAFPEEAWWERQVQQQVLNTGQTETYFGRPRRPVFAEVVRNPAKWQRFRELGDAKPGRERARLSALWNEMRKPAAPIRKHQFIKAKGTKLHKALKRMRNRAQRQGYNGIPQGTVADAINLVLPQIAKRYMPVFQVHDEVGFLVEEDKGREAVEFVNKVMPFDVGPLTIDTDAHIGHSWAEAK